MTIDFPAGDYVSPGLERVSLDFAFPNMVVGSPAINPWPYLRREIPHNWYVDRRVASMGFINRDEAHLLYNSALLWRGKKALEIGCWLGWSAAHLVAARVPLDIIDPALQDQGVLQSVVQGLRAVAEKFHVNSQIVLHPGRSPGKVEELAAGGNRWSLFFIDGNHLAPEPLQDTIVCERFAEQEAMILLHDLAAPDVGTGLDYLRGRGWHTLVYQTMQIMGVAWRGPVGPIKHQPDPNVSWTLPPHLAGYAVSGA
jgi:hypothetical protein